MDLGTPPYMFYVLYSLRRTNFIFYKVRILTRRSDRKNSRPNGTKQHSAIHASGLTELKATYQSMLAFWLCRGAIRDSDYRVGQTEIERASTKKMKKLNKKGGRRVFTAGALDSGLEARRLKYKYKRKQRKF